MVGKFEYFQLLNITAIFVLFRPRGRISNKTDLNITNSMETIPRLCGHKTLHIHLKYYFSEGLFLMPY